MSENEAVNWVTWLTNNWETILVVILALIPGFRAVAHLTPTDKDDKLVDRIEAFVTTLIKVFTKKPIQTEAKFGELDKQGHKRGE